MDRSLRPHGRGDSAVVRTRPRALILVSGGQTGADQGALEAALACNIPIIGWCPGGRWTEAGPLDPCWPLMPTPSRRPIERTLRNLRLADGVLILAGRRLRGGSIVLPRAGRISRPRLVVDPWTQRAVPAAVRFCVRYRITKLLVGGPRESEEPGLHDAARTMMMRVFAEPRLWASFPLDRARRL